ncbi:MAG: 23S rRNA (guanosine(2251)-2'-O)-methyltransferase RlmB [Gammaproteobacteria bacterium]
MSTQSVFGWHAVSHLLHNAPQRVLSVRMQNDRDDARARELLAAIDIAGTHLERVPREQLDKLADDASHQGVIATIRASQERGEDELFDLVAKRGDELLLLILDSVQDPHNLGACLRSADGAGVHGVIAPKRRAVGLTDTVRKVASGAAETVPFFRVTNLSRTLTTLGDAGVWRVGTSDQASEPLWQARFTGPLALVMGGEAKGMRRLTTEKCDALISLPMHGAVSSLNVSVATGIVLYEAVRQRIAPSSTNQ